LHQRQRLLDVKTTLHIGVEVFVNVLAVILPSAAWLPAPALAKTMSRVALGLHRR